jgi:hypothetical protein
MFKRILRLTLVALLLGAFLGACGDDDDGGSSSGDDSDTTEAGAEVQQLKVTAQEYSYTGASTVKGGWVNLTLDNKGKEGHQAQLLRINDGVTPAQLQEAASDTTGGKLLALVTPKGGVNAINAGESQSAVTELDAGNYLMMCFVPAPDGQPHVAKGMQAPFTVEAGAAEGDEPKYDFEIEAKDFTFEIPDIESGEHAIEFKNNGPSPHEGTLYKVAAGKTVEDVQKALAAEGTPSSGPPPFTPEGGAAAILPGTGTFPTISFTPGTYVLVCFIPDQKTGKPHIQLGMFSSFEVK